MDNDTGRIEAFSDGVFAVAITLLALDIHVPPYHEKPLTNLGGELLAQGPTYLAYVTSFLTVLVMWMNHHRLFQHIGRKDHGLLYNGFLLMVVTLFPFPTAMLAEYLPHGGTNAMVASEIYSAFSVVMAILFNRLWHHAADGGRLLAADHNRHSARRITEQYRFGPLLYAVAFAAAFVSPPLSVFLSLSLAVFFAPPEKPAPEASAP